MSTEQPRPDLDMLADYLAGLLPEAQRLEVERALAEDPSTASFLAELEALPSLLAADPPEPMPEDVAARIDAALADERAGRGDHVATVHPISRRRRWLAPALVAAAMVGLVGIGAQVVNDVGGMDSAETAETADSGAMAADETAPDSVSEGTPEAAPATRKPQRLVEGFVNLRSGSFAQDLNAVFASTAATYIDRRALLSALRVTGTASGALDDAYTIIDDDCAAELRAGRFLAIRLDGEPALLVLRRIPGEPNHRQALAYPARCPSAAPEENGGGPVSPLASGKVILP